MCFSTNIYFVLFFNGFFCSSDYPTLFVFRPWPGPMRFYCATSKTCILPHRSQWRRLGSCCPRSHRLWGTDCPLSSRSSYFVSSTSGWSCLQDVSSLLRCCCYQFVLKYQNYFYLNKQRVNENHFTVDNPLMLFYLLRALFDSSTQ